MILEMSNIKKHFEDCEVLHDISLNVDSGDVVSIIGPSGSGKSTLLRCATFLEKIDSGTIKYVDQTIAHTPEGGKPIYLPKKEMVKVKSYFGLVFQQFNLFPHYSVLKNVCDAPINVQKRDKKEVDGIFSLLKIISTCIQPQYVPARIPAMIFPSLSYSTIFKSS